MATAVISASEAMHYLHDIVKSLPVVYATLGLLFLFLLLNIMGISESAKVALVIFIFHLTSMLVLIISAFIFLFNHGTEILQQNFSMPIKGGSIGTALFFGFSAAMLGISGFESSANFVEEQKKGVFPKTLKNMWLAVSILNPLIAFLAIGVMSLTQVEAHESSFLNYMASLTGGRVLAIIISINAVTVLSGAVLTSFVGVNGLIKRMALDRILPQFFLKENKRGSSYRILITFFILCVSVLFVTNGEIGPLAGVYTISFLIVMAFFAIGNLLLKIRRARLPRPEYASPAVVLLALLGVIIALYGNVKMKPEYLVVFLQYFIPSMLLIFAMLGRNHIFTFILGILKKFNERMRKFSLLSQFKINKSIEKLHEQEFVFFSKGDNVAILNKVMMYVQENEITRKIKIVTVLKENQIELKQFLIDFEVLDRAYPEIKMEYMPIVGEFGPELIDKLSIQWNIPKNFMFISSPSDRFSYRVEDLGGVRLIL
jgi:amino acid transporter